MTPTNDAYSSLAKSLLRIFLRLRHDGRVGNIERTVVYPEEVNELPKNSYAVVVTEIRYFGESPREDGQDAC
jgi:hypothetical protein